MKKAVMYLIIALSLAILILTSCNNKAAIEASENNISENNTSENSAENSSESKSKAGEVSSPAKIGDYVSFGNYYEEPILWKIVDFKDSNPILWSVHILTAKCFDSAESGTASMGETDAEKYGSNLWSNSNIREWLNATGSVAWSTNPPTKEAMWGNNDYSNEAGFLTNFSDHDKALIVPTERKIYTSNDEYKETTQDLVFLASYAEVFNGGEWGFISAIDRKKSPTEKAMQNNKNEYPDIRLASFYYLCTQGVGSTSWQICGVRDTGEFYTGDPHESYHGIAPAVQISAAKPISGSGTQQDPWIF